MGTLAAVSRCGKPEGVKKRLRTADIAKLKAPRKKGTRTSYAYVVDTEMPSISVRLASSGSRAWVVRHGGHESKRTTLGSWPEMTYADAVQAAAQVLAAVQVPLPKRKRSAPRTWDDVVEIFKVEHVSRRSGRTPGEDRNQVRRLGIFCETFGSKRPRDLTSADVRTWLEPHVQRAPTEANRLRALARQLWNYAFRMGGLVIGANPVSADTVRAQKENRRRRDITSEEAARLLRGIEALGDAEARDAILWVWAVAGRCSEALTLRWENVRDSVAWIPDSKGGHPLTWPLEGLTAEIIKRQRARVGASNPWVFPSPKDRSKPRKFPVRQFRAAVKDADLKDVQPKDLRHLRATQAVRGGAPIASVSRMLGHTDVSVTMRYLDLGAEDYRGIVAMPLAGVGS
jgi:integrase